MTTSNTITRTDLTNILNDILPVYNSTGFTVEKFTALSATSVSANGGTAWIQVRIPSGYEPVCIVGYYLNGGSGCSVYNEAIAKDSNGYYCSFALRNGQSTVNTVTIDAYVLCKQSLTHFTQAMADYIVEQGTSGMWTYRKWNSGIAECWGYKSISKTFASWGSWYYVSAEADNYPTGLFTTVTNVQGQLTMASADTISSIVGGVHSTSKPPNITGVRPTNATSTYAGLAYWNAKGRWK